MNNFKKNDYNVITQNDVVSSSLHVLLKHHGQPDIFQAKIN